MKIQSFIERDHAFSGGPYFNYRQYSPDIERHIHGQLGSGDFRQPAIIVEYHQNQVTDFKIRRL